MTIDRVAATGFQAGAGAYERARPGYPSDAVAWLTDRLGVGPGSRVVDLGAGTGKFTVSLIEAGARVVAVEPVEAMRSQLAAVVPEASIVAGAAEAIPLTGGSMDAVVAAQAFHWFDAARCLPEIHRVLAAGGRLGLMWNARDRSTPWVDQLSEIVDAYGDAIRRHESGEWRTAFPSPGFGPLEERIFSNIQRISPEGIVDRVASTSFIARLPEVDRAGVLERIRELVRTNPETRDRDLIDFPHQTRAYWCERI
ncbi:MAG: class I SAM-dependent methyltransferase [Actinomycetota bacterium]